MKIDVQIDDRILQARLPKEQKRLVYNTVAAINETMLAVQAAIRDHVAKEFRLRNTTKRDRKFLLEQIKLNRAGVNKGQLFAEVYIAHKQRLLLAGFEDGDIRTPFVGKNVAIPNPEEARQGGTFEGAIKDDVTFKSLKLRTTTTGDPKNAKSGSRAYWSWTKEGGALIKSQGGKTQIQGANRTFILKTKKNPLGGVYQRVGPGPDDIRLVYSFKRAFHLRKMLDFIKTAQTVIRDKFKVELAIAYAKGGGLPQ